MPQQAARAHSQKDLPPSVEAAYYRKCIELRRRINDIAESNDSTRQRILRLNRGVQKMRLERAFLLEQLNKHMEYNIDDSDRSSSPPPTPTDKPLRSKRSHNNNRKGTPPPPTSTAQVGGGSGSVSGGLQHQSPGGGAQQQHQSILHPINPMSSAQSTPDPNRVSTSNYFATIGATTATSPHAAVNGAPLLPPLHALQPLSQRPPEPSRAYFDPAYDEQRPTPATETDNDAAARPRAYSGAQQPPPVEVAPQNGDTEMTDAGFTSVNR
ncbi:hypothetical protein GQ44DRAFT_716552 [Phaeosphaeriaceae sp. PMI808]|nr:hypothetical protein GQ44DRAFT_716552 [Phaeosphaeriaceae sp. PMI808]